MKDEDLRDLLCELYEIKDELKKTMIKIDTISEGLESALYRSVMRKLPKKLNSEEA